MSSDPVSLSIAALFPVTRPAIRKSATGTGSKSGDLPTAFPICRANSAVDTGTPSLTRKTSPAARECSAQTTIASARLRTSSRLRRFSVIAPNGKGQPRRIAPASEARLPLTPCPTIRGGRKITTSSPVRAPISCNASSASYLETHTDRRGPASRFRSKLGPATCPRRSP